MSVKKIDIAVFLFLFSLLTGCFPDRDKKINPRISLWQKDKIPYGTWYAHASLADYFPSSGEINEQKISPERLADFQRYYWNINTYNEDDTLVTTEPVVEEEEVVEPGSAPPTDDAVGQAMSEAASDIAVPDIDSAVNVVRDSILAVTDSLAVEPSYDTSMYEEEEEAESEPALERELYMIVSPQFYPTEKEQELLLRYVSNGNHLFIAAFDFGKSFLDTLKLQLDYQGLIFNQKDTLLYLIRSSTNELVKPYGYPGFGMDQFFVFQEALDWEILGQTRQEKPNFIRIRKDSGSITLISNPLLLSNFFLLHKNNHEAFEAMMAGLPAHYSRIWWDEYYRHADPDRSSFSSLGVFMKYPSLRWALYTSLLMLTLLLLSELKRRRKIIPLQPAVENSSLD
ncbi:DUF4350 domain-containing protein, partial [Flavihumibacter sp. CACIAM 22H1]|uniref:DUF4350 domain-containing protein n=1 Tax=Flavihumibacter sp. CACIAM 22H1 TaxID=1812911 RepID=UPI0025BF5D27